MKKKDCLITTKNKKEIFWNLINTFLCGLISFLSALLAVGELTSRVIIVSVITAGLVASSKFNDYWAKEKKEYSNKIFTIISN